MINLIKNINYRDLIGYYYYISDYIPYAIIDNVIKMPNNYYRIYLKDIKNTKYLNYVDLTYEELLSLYNKLLIRKERSEILKERNIEKIVHFTKVENLESIFENGILSVNRLNDSSIAYSPSDLFRLDDKLNMISTSISFPNYKMFYSKRKLISLYDKFFSLNKDLHDKELFLKEELRNEFYPIYESNKGTFIYTDYIYCLFDELLKIVDKVNFIKINGVFIEENDYCKVVSLYNRLLNERENVSILYEELKRINSNLSKGFLLNKSILLKVNENEK